MERFVEGVKRVCVNDTPDQIELVLEDLLKRKIRRVDLRTISPVAGVPLKVFQLFQIGLWRTTELAEAAVRELNREHVSSSHVLVRAVYETCALMLETIRRVEELVNSGDVAKVNDLDGFLKDVLLGSKSKEWSFSEEYAARNVLTLLQKLTKATGLNLMGFYETLSERAHPNYLGMLAVYHRRSPEPDRSFPEQ